MGFDKEDVGLIVGTFTGVSAQYVIDKALDYVVPTNMKTAAKVAWFVGSKAVRVVVFDATYKTAKHGIDSAIEFGKGIKNHINDRKDSKKYGLKVVTVKCEEC